MQVIKKILKWGAIGYVFGIAGMSAIMLLANGWDFVVEQPGTFARTVFMWPLTLLFGVMAAIWWRRD